MINEKKHFSEYEVTKLITEISRGMEYLHNNKIIHRDLKPANILFDEDDSAKIGDFGISKELTKSYASTIAGTPMYMSPEQYAKKCTVQSDVWALGCIAHEICTLKVFL